MIDFVKITIKSGNGGNGIVSFTRESNNPLGGPSGGKGGDGGDVIFISSTTMKTLSKFKYKKHFFAEDGSNGGTTKKKGSKGKDITIFVPVGTVIDYIDDEGKQITHDFDYPEKQIILITGGKGGLGNSKFVSATNQEPLLAESGELGKQLYIKMELKLLADVGIIGMPNAGKSSLLNIISSAKSKTANYPFTTLEPKLGTINNDFEEVILVDIPGLIKDAHKGVGLGHDFLKHIQRTKMLIHLVDGSEDDISERIISINNEMEKFDISLKQVPQILVINKIDLDEVSVLKQEIINQIKESNIDHKPIFISAITSEGINNLVQLITKEIKIIRKIESTKIQKVEEPNIIVPNMKIHYQSVVQETDSSYRIIHPRAIRIAKASNLEDWATLIQFQARLERMGVNNSLREKGIKQGDTVLINEWDFQWD